MSPIPLYVSPASSSGDVVALQNLLDSLGTDAILRSGDSREVRVPKLYIAKFSPVLGALFHDASNSTVHVNPDALLPTVQLSESGVTLIRLISFIFPLSPTLPPTSAIEETMELLSAAQKYEMSSVLAHIRLCLAQQDPPFIRKDNAFRAYSLAQKYGLRQEAVKSAELTLELSLTLRDLEGRLDIMPGAYLHELWTFHEIFRRSARSDVRDFEVSSASSMPKGLKCTSRGLFGIPSWLYCYITSCICAFFPHDFVEYQKAWVRHVKETRCPNCGEISPEVIRTIWTDIDTVFRGSLKKAEADLTILGGDSHSRTRAGSPTTLSLPECVDVSQADIIVRSSDHDMFSLSQPSNNEAVDELPVIQLSEDAEVLRALITALYSIPFEIPASYDKILALLAAAQKYDMGSVQSSIRAEVSHRKLSILNGAQVFRAYAIASSKGLVPEMDMVARLSLDLPMTFEYIGIELRLFEGWALRALVEFRILYIDNLISCFKSFFDTNTGPSKIWIACPGPKCDTFIFPRFVNISLGNWSQFDEVGPGLENSLAAFDPLAPRIYADKPGGGEAGASSLPAWLHDAFKEEIDLGSRTFEKPLVRPSDIRAKYMSALQGHVTTDKCAFCMEVHALEGEKYVVEMEHALTQARNKTTLEVS
ncbi:hypothetical protein EDB92DRAFT_2112692 [Lactarius akahatsu]|uniref:BTB domain-containing protein n=1 Tax=Lactarius akahatsu TaxID=416441 RepID=A0AAD4QFQ8_9AGAM|nr:hypothetical protein EDB92DRAFT_2112692 [Lactarius akahatsu]